MDNQPQLESDIAQRTQSLLDSAQALLTDWTQAKAQEIYEAAELIAERAQEDWQDDLSEALLSFSAYLSFFADSVSVPGDSHLAQLRALIDAVAESLQRYIARIQSTTPATSTPALKPAGAATVLFFGSNAATLELVTHRLVPFGYRIEAHTSIETMAPALAKDNVLALVLDSLALGAWLVATERQDMGVRVPVVVVSGNDTIELRLAAMRCAAEVFFVLPGDADRIALRLAGVIADRTEPYRVLIVDDDNTMRLFCDSVLRHNNLITCPVAAPEDALYALAEFTPDVVLADLYMPGLTGFELLALFRAHPRTAFTPVVLLSGDTDPEKRFAALHIGGDDYLTKPIRPRHLVAAIVSRARRARWIRSELLTMRLADK